MKKNWFNKSWLENEYVVLLYQFGVLLVLYAICRLLFYGLTATG